MSSPPLSDDGDITPRPDPTRLTTEQLYREILWLRSLLEQRIGALESLVETRFKERDGRFEQVEVSLMERGRRIAALEASEAAFATRITTIEAHRAGASWIIAPIIALGTLVIAAIGLLVDHMFRGTGGH